ncbi:MAG TPA: antibiotic biosynthesis monooxygenase family protein [Rummeliibacillus sp.]|nr:antibiotic biosynthesis monooxygenase family protein [Rummeliibacillus sp.]
MFIYLTLGTPEFMVSLQKKYPKEKMVVLYGQGNAVLLHESAKKSVFASPRSYEIIREINTLDEHGFFVLNHIPVKSESRKLFEDRFFERIHTIENEPGFIAFRLLRPLNDEVYISLSEWTGPHSFEAWKSSKAYKDIYENEKPTEGVDRSNIFTSAPYVKTYITSRPEEEL